MAKQMLTYDDKDMEQGKFYFIEANLDQASNVREVTTITKPLNDLQNYFEDYKDIILDNQSRVNNLEGTEIKRILEYLDRVSITFPFTNATHIEIQHNRKIVTNVLIMQEIVNTPTKKQYRRVFANFDEVEDLVSDRWIKKVIIETDIPITGYVVLL